MDPLLAASVPGVRPREQFRGVLDSGQVVEGTAPYNTTFSDQYKYYKLQIPNGSMFRPDGMRIGFVKGIFETNVLETQQYLDAEIARNHPYLRLATFQEVEEFKIARDPKGFYTEQVSEDIEVKLRQEFEAKLDAILNAPVGSAVASNIDAEKLSALDALKAKVSRGESIASGTGKVFMSSEAAPLKGIVGSDSIKDGAAGSGK